MSKYNIPTILDADRDISTSAEIGAETRVFISYDEVKVLAELELDAAGDGTTNANSVFTADNAYVAPVAIGSGYDLQLVCLGPILSAVDVAIVLNVMVNGLSLAVTNITAANPTVITTASVHGLTTGQTVTISGVTGNTPSTINANFTATVLSTTTFSIPLTTTVAGTGGVSQGPARTSTASATLAGPDTAHDQSSNFPPGLAVDFATVLSGTVAGAGTTATVRTVTSVASITGGSAGAKFAIVACPASTSYTEVACATNKSFDPPTPKSIAIACRFDSARWVKKGRDKEKMLNVDAKYAAYGDGLPRVNGQRVTAKLETRKDDRILTERLIFGGWRPEISITKGEGDTEADAKATGRFELFAAFV